MTTATKPPAVVTGASGGIGLELAERFARHDFGLVTTAEDGAPAAADAQVRACGAPVGPARPGLAHPEGVEELVDAAEAPAVDAGGESAGDTRPEDRLTVVDPNVRSALHRAERVVPGTAGRGHGRVPFTSSIAGAGLGPADTEFFGRADAEDTELAVSRKDSPAEITEAGFEALMSGKDEEVAGMAGNKVQAAGPRLLPDETKAARHGKPTGPGTAAR